MSYSLQSLYSPARTVLKVHGETVSGTVTGYHRRCKDKYLGILDMRRPFIYLVDYGSIALVLVRTIVPRLEPYHHHGVRSSASREGETGNLVVSLNLVYILNAVLHLGEDVVGLVQSSTWRRVHADEKGSGIFIRHQRCLGCHHEINQKSAGHNQTGDTYPFVFDKELDSMLVFVDQTSE